MQLALWLALVSQEPAPETTPPATPAPVVTPAPAEAPPATSETSESSSRPVVRAGLEIGAYRDSVGVSVLTPSVHASIASPTGEWAVNGQYLVDMVSAASPDIVTTASPNFKELRQAGALGVKYKPGTFEVSANANISSSNDYLALVGGIHLAKELDEKNLTLLGGYSYGHDTIGRTDTPFDVFSRKLDYHGINVGVAKLLNPAAVLTITGDAVIERGDQSKPYRYVPVFLPTTSVQLPRGASPDQVADARSQARPLEQLPLQRDRYAVTGRLAWRFTSTTLRVEERAYIDTWGMHASTTDGKYVIDVFDRLAVWPHLRFHMQDGVSFWQRAYYSNGVDDLPALRTGDRELSPLISGSLGVGSRISLGKPGKLDDLLLVFSADSTYTDFLDALYVTERLSLLLTAGFEAVF